MLVSAAQAETVRPEVGKPLQAAQSLIKSGKFRDALKRVDEAEAVSGRTAYENFVIERMRMAAASGAGDVETAARSFDVLSASGKVSAAEKIRMAESIAGTYYRGNAESEDAANSIRSMLKSATPTGFRFEDKIELDPGVRFPRDSSAKILTSGLLGDQYIGIEAGVADENLAAGSVIARTQSAVVLENLIGQLVTGKAAEAASQAGSGQ